MVTAQDESRVPEPAARYGKVGFYRIELPVSICQQTFFAAEDRLLIQQAGLPDPFVHATDRLFLP